MALLSHTRAARDAETPRPRADARAAGPERAGVAALGPGVRP